jgi:hypothetical protein
MNSLCLKRDCLAHFDPIERNWFCPQLATIAAIGLGKYYARSESGAHLVMLMFIDQL